MNAKIPPAPTRAELDEALGPAHSLWEQVRHVLNRECIPLTEEWVYSGRRALRFRHKYRLLLYLKPLVTESCALTCASAKTCWSSNS